MIRQPAPNLIFFSALLAVFVTLATPLEAHRINIFVLYDGAGLTGSLFYSGGGKAQNAEVQIYAPEGQSIAVTRTDSDGQFHVPKALLKNHLGQTVKVRGNTGDGHGAEMFVLVGNPDNPSTVTAPNQAADDGLPAWRQYVGAVSLIFGLFGMMYWLKSRKPR